MPDKVLAFYIRLSSEDRDLKTKADGALFLRLRPR